MWETWEYRAEDLDLGECRRLGIPVLGTNEHHSDLRIFEYIGHVAMKLLFALDIEAFRSHLVVIGSGEFAQCVFTTLCDAKAEVTLLNPRIKGILKSNQARCAFQKADAIVLVEHHSRNELIGTLGEISAEELWSMNPGISVAHICGGADRTALESVGLRCCPNKFSAPGYMSVATDYVGPRPLIDLCTAGLKVAERLAHTRASGLTAREAELAVLLETPLAQGFKN
jgi:hypothetical protein